ncbi:MAG TPA: hypothetical protein VMU83_16635 [Hanamia sp.]|nr:hypothetical protein [Hanamia sp.]
MNHSEHHHNENESKSSEEAKADLNKLQDHFAEKTEHGQEAVMDHSKMDHSNHGAIPMGMAGHDHHKMMIQDFKKRFWISPIISIPILVFSPMIQNFFGYQWLLPGNPYILFALSSIVYFWGGWPFLKGFAAEIKARNPGMMTLIVQGYFSRLFL